MNKESKIVLSGLFLLSVLTITCIANSYMYNYEEKKLSLKTISNKSTTITLSSSFISDEYREFVYK